MELPGFKRPPRSGFENPYYLGHGAAAMDAPLLATEEKALRLKFHWT